MLYLQLIITHYTSEIQQESLAIPDFQTAIVLLLITELKNLTYYL